MTVFPQLPARLRLTMSFAVAMAALLTVCGAVIYTTVAATLLDELETGLRARAATVQDALRDPDFHLTTPSAALLESREQFVQVLTPGGRVLDSTPGMTAPVLPPGDVGLTGPRWFQRPVSGVVGDARILTVPARRGATPVALAVGASMSDRSDALNHVAGLLFTGGPLTLLAASALGGWLAGAAMRPIERMRGEASAISMSDLGHRLTLPAANDEFRRLAMTLNDMLARLDAATASERRFLEDASHQLRTPLASLRTELELALRRPRSTDDMRAALVSSLAEADRLADMTETLLVSARQRGRHVLTYRRIRLSELLQQSAQLFQERAADARVHLSLQASDDLIDLDAARIRQALDNLIDNALRYAPSATTLTVRGDHQDGRVRITVEDAGPGFSRTAATVDARDSHGLGLAYVTAVVAAHGGTVTMDGSRLGGARVTLTIPVDRQFHQDDGSLEQGSRPVPPTGAWH